MSSDFLDMAIHHAEPARIIVIDDDAVDRMKLIKALSIVFRDAEIVEACSVHDGVNRIAESWFDLIIVDFNLGDGSGVDLALQVACLVDDPVPPPIIMVTADEQTSTAVQALRVGIYDFILKSLLTVSSIQRATSHALEKWHLERANMEAHRTLYIQAQKLQRSNEALSQFAAVASHDLKEPLRTIGGFAQLLEKRYHDKFDSDGQEYLAFITDAVSRMGGLIDGLLAFANVGHSLEYSTIDLNSLINNCVASLRRLIETNNAEISVGELPEINGDPRLITQLFQNLLSNAVKFRGEADPKVAIGAEKSSQGWRISVSDNGIGIAAEHFERIFKMFTRLSSAEAYPGSGIGLSLCKRIVEHHHGHITIQSTAGSGTTFHIDLPFSQDTPKPLVRPNQRSLEKSAALTEV